VALDLMGDRIEDMAVKSPVAMVAALDEAAKDAGGGSRAGMMERMRRLFADALDYERRTADYRKNGMQELSAPVADLEALLPVLHGKLPIMIAANRRSDIENALRLAKEYKLKLILVGAAEGWEVADEIKAAGVPVLLDPLVDIPSYDALSPRLDNAALLRKAGVTVAIASFDSHNTRDVRQSAGNAVANGMAWDDALRAVTLDAARELEINGSYGSLEPGKVANVVVWTGDPFEFSSYPSAVFIRGKAVPKDSRQHELFERYKTLPPTY
ncbi:MAG TPA: amidohydrolase family protein, partial [Gemmatimonadales bacterium]|nr:amidohydrolase family protein [Gemmatimonadales bacterium]